MKKRETVDIAFYRKLGKIIAEERRKKGYSLRYLSELTGITRVTIDNYELGKHRIELNRWKKICEALQISDKIDVKIALGVRDYE